MWNDPNKLGPTGKQATLALALTILSVGIVALRSWMVVIMELVRRMP